MNEDFPTQTSMLIRAFPMPPLPGSAAKAATSLSSAAAGRRSEAGI